MATKQVMIKDEGDFILPITTGKAVYLDNKGIAVDDVVNNRHILTGTNLDKHLIIYHYNVSAVNAKKFKYRFMGIMQDNSIYNADIFVTSVGGNNTYLLTNNTNNQTLPDVKVIDRCLAIDLSNIKEYYMYNEYYDKCMYDRYEAGETITINIYDKIMETNSNILPSHTDYNDFINNV
ncbi:MAG: hypothetical protein ACRCXT_16505, partial [Paraclostridium sp.]